MTIDELREVCPPTHVILPVEVAKLLILAGEVVYAPAIIQQGRTVAEIHNAAAAAQHVLDRAAGKTNPQQ